MGLTPLPQLTASRYMISAFKLTPNTSIVNRPLLIYRSVFSDKDATASSIEAHFKRIGAVLPRWRYTMYSTSHFHSTSHEVLGIANGSATLCFGHEDNRERVVTTVRRGDVILIPAGTAHRLLDDLEGGFLMVGAYPPGCDWDMCYGTGGEEAKVQAINSLEWFKKDPVYGDEGPAIA